MKEQDNDLSDPVFADMIMPDPAERRKFLKVCRESYDLNFQINRRGELLGLVANYVGFADWKVYVSLLLQMKFVNLHGENVCQELTSYTTFGTEGGSWSYSSDRDGRISVLHLAPRNPCDLPAGIRQLDYLQRLCIFSQNFNSLPLGELSMLPQFESMYLGGCSDRLSDSFLAQASVKFPRLKSLSLCGPPSFRMLYSCVALEHIALFFVDDSDIDVILETLQTSDFSFGETLRSIEFTGGHCRMKDHHLETFLFDVVPRFPNLEKMEFLGSTLDIRSFKVVADRIRKEKLCIRSNESVRSVRFFGQYGLEELDEINRDPGIKEGILTFLRTYLAVERVDFPRGIEIQPEWEYALITNMVGQRLLEGGAFGGNKDGSSVLPLAIWPEVLDRAQQKCNKTYLCHHCRTRAQATGIYYLLREGPVLVGRGDLLAKPDDCPPSPPPKRHRRE